MAIAFHVAGTPATGTTALSVVIPATASVGDILILSTETCASTLVSSAVTATGWTQRGTAFDVGSTAPCPTITVLWRACIAGDPGSTVVCSFANAPTTTVGTINAYSGVDLTAPFETSAAAEDLTGGATTHIFPSITTTKATDWLITAIGTRNGDTWTPPTPPTMTERSDNASGGVANLQTADTNGTVAAATYSTVGATGTTVSTSMCVMFIGALQVPTGPNPSITPSTLAPTTVAATTGTTWTNTANATGVTTATFATWTNAVSGGTGNIQLSGYPVQSYLLDPAVTITQVAVTVGSWVGSVTNVTAASVQLYTGTTALGSPTALTLSVTTTNTQTVNLTGANCPTWAQCVDLRAQVNFTHAANTTSSTGNVDFVTIQVSFTGGVLNSFEATAGGTTISAGNSGPPGMPFPNVFTTSATAAFSTAQCHSGTRSLQLATAGTSAVAGVSWASYVGNQGTIYGRIYLYRTVDPAVGYRLITLSDNAGTNLNAAILITTTGKLTMNSGGGGAMATAGTVQLTTTASVNTNAWSRIEFKCIGSATVGQLELKLYNNADSIVPTETLTSAANLNTTGIHGRYDFGPTIFGITNMTSIYIDDVGMSSVGYLGPALQRFTASAAAGANTNNLVTTIPTAVAAGTLVMISYISWGFGDVSTTVSIVDSKGNTWTNHIDARNGTVGVIQHWSSVLTTPWVAADTVTVTSVAAASLHDYAMAVDVMSGYTNIGTQAGTLTTSTSTAPSATLTPSGSPTSALIYGFLSTMTTAPVITEDADVAGGSGWLSLPKVTTATASRLVQLAGALKISTPGSTAQTYNPTLAASQLWESYVVMYPAAGVAVDASTPARVNGSATNGTLAVTTAAFNPPVSVLVAAFACNARVGTGNGTVSNIVMTNNGAALTWTTANLRHLGDSGGNRGCAAILTAPLTAGRSGMTVTATVTPNNAADINTPSLKLYVVTGADMTNPLGASTEGSSLTNAITTTAFTTQAASSWGVWSGCEWNALGAITSSDTTVDTFANTGVSVSTGSGYKTLGAAGSSATFNLDAGGTAAAEWNWVSAEIKAAGGPAVTVLPQPVTNINQMSLQRAASW